MAINLVSELHYANKQDREPWDDTLYLRAAEEIKRLQVQTLQLTDEIESLRLAYQQAMTEFSRSVQEVERLRRELALRG